MVNIINYQEFQALLENWSHSKNNAFLHHLAPFDLDFKFKDKKIIKEFRKQFEEEQATAPWDVDNFSDELKKDKDTLLVLSWFNPYQLKKLDKSLFQNRQIMKEFLVDWFFETIKYNKNKWIGEWLDLTCYVFKITNEDVWFWQGILDLGLLPPDQIPVVVLEKLDLEPSL